MLQFDLDQIPFSLHGSWFNLSRVVGTARYADDVHLVSHQTGLHPVLRLAPVIAEGQPRAETVAAPSLLRWVVGDGTIEAAYEDVDTLRMRGRGAGMAVLAAIDTLTPFSGPYLVQDPRDGSLVFTTYETGRRYRVTVLAAEPRRIMGVQELGTAQRGLELPGDRPWEIVIEEFETSREPYRRRDDFETVVARCVAQFEAFATEVAPSRGAHPAAELAAYTIWSATVRPAGFLTRSSVLMSKHWMDKVWSWDHCFNALALGRGAPELAWDQFFGVFDHQDASGALPDSITHSETLYNFVKPPIHGWAFAALRHRLARALNQDELQVGYDRLRDWTRFWLDQRRAAGSVLPHYQHGNDSGWDNATTFAVERMVETADLAAFLVLQLDTLAGLADELARLQEAEHWREQAAELLAALLDELWDGERFVARGVASGQQRHSRSLLDLMPIVLGDQLPRDVADALASAVADHLAPAGLATEHPSSELYEADGYWRGPVWAPSTVLVEDGLRRAGHVQLADEISARFRSLCERSGFAENFDALTGDGLRDRAYTWTAAAYLLLCAQADERAVARGR